MTTAWHWWYEAWETHMDGFLPARDSVLDLLCELLADLTGPAPRILEVGSGTGSLAARAVTHLPDATVVGVDLDPLLQAFGEHVLGDLGGRLRRHDADLRANDWHHGLTGEFDAVISVAALHMLGAHDTTRVLTDLGALLRPDGVLLDLDWATRRSRLAASRPRCAVSSDVATTRPRRPCSHSTASRWRPIPSSPAWTPCGATASAPRLRRSRPPSTPPDTAVRCSTPASSPSSRSGATST
jgi:SAM-dependent methyltransferase